MQLLEDFDPRIPDDGYICIWLEIGGLPIVTCRCQLLFTRVASANN